MQMNMGSQNFTPTDYRNPYDSSDFMQKLRQSLAAGAGPRAPEQVQNPSPGPWAPTVPMPGMSNRSGLGINVSLGGSNPGVSIGNRNPSPGSGGGGSDPQYQYGQMYYGAPGNDYYYGTSVGSGSGSPNYIPSVNSTISYGGAMPDYNGTAGGGIGPGYGGSKDEMDRMYGPNSWDGYGSDWID